MKLKGAKAVHYDSGPNMTPLVDVVMVILIFLMLTGSFGAASHFLPSTMPIKEKGKGQIDPKNIPKVPDPQLDIFISSEGVSNTFRARVGTDANVYTDVESLYSVLNNKRLQHVASGSTPDKMQIILTPRLQTKFSHVMQVYECAMRAEWPKIGFQSAKD